MNRVASRAGIAILLALLLIAGLGFFVAEYVMNAEDWVMCAGSPMSIPAAISAAVLWWTQKVTPFWI